jgi:beta-glucanase (GH16 family)
MSEPKYPDSMAKRLILVESGICLALLFLMTACSALPPLNGLVGMSTPTKDALQANLSVIDVATVITESRPESAPVETNLALTSTPPFRGAKLIFDDEFSGDQLDTSYWTTEYRWGRTNEPELQYYSPDAIQVEDGILRITADANQMEGMDYTSGMIASYDRFTFTYGYLEMRAKIPAGQGLWPAFWMHLNDDDQSGEIDIFEFLGHEPNIIHMAYHFPELQQFWFNGPDYSQDYHTYAVDWQPDHIIWYIDGVERARATNAIPNEPMYIIVNLAVGGLWPRNPDQSTRFPAYYDVDYIRVYQR